MYPNWNPKDLKAAVQIWHEALKEYPYEEMYFSLMQFFKHDTKGFAPIPGQLIQPVLEKRVSAFAPDEGKAWALVHDAIENGIYGSELEFKRLPSIIQQAVGSPKEIQAWAMADSESMEVIRSNFLRAYRIVKDRAIADGKIPDAYTGIEQKFDLTYLIEEKTPAMSEEDRADALAWWEELKNAK